MILSLQKTSDQIQWTALLEGNKAALSELYERYFDLLYEYGLRFCHDREKLKDCIQDMFIKLWTNRKNLSKTTSVKPYLYTSLRHTIINKLDQEKHAKERECKSMNYPAFKMHYDIERKIIQTEEDWERNALIKNALERLTARQKECIYLRFYSGLEYNEIASIMNISVKSTYKMVGRSIGLLRKYMAELTIYSLYISIFLHLFS